MGKYKYKVITEYGTSAFHTAMEAAISYGWEVFIPATVNSETNWWMITMRKLDE